MPWTGMFLEMGGDWFDADGNLALVTPEKEMPAGAEIC